MEEVIPESQRNKHTEVATGGAISGFLVMMIMDVTLGEMIWDIDLGNKVGWASRDRIFPVERRSQR